MTQDIRQDIPETLAPVRSAEPSPESPAPSPSLLERAASAEYALILGSGAGVAVSIATQQAMIASLPLTALVAMGLLNRHRLDHQVQTSPQETPATRQAAADNVPKQVNVTAVPAPEWGSPRSHPTLAASPSVRPGFSQRRLTRVPKVAVSEAQLQVVGAQLQRTRLAQGLSLQQVHIRTYIQMHQLRAIEMADLRALPAGIYVQSFVAKYATVLGLDGAEVAASLTADVGFAL